MIGVFDSGIGGLTVLTHLQQAMPTVPFIYVADHAYAPYGDLSRQAVVRRSEQLTSWLIEQGCLTIVVACNTATALAIDHLRQTYKVPFIGVEPGIKPAVHQSKSAIGILATQNTSASERYQHLLQRLNPAVPVYTQSCTGLADAIENCAATQLILQHYVTPLVNQGVDHLVLGCTHYPLVQPAIVELAPNVDIIDTGPAVAAEAKRQYLKLNAPQTHQAVSLYSTGKSAHMLSAIEFYDMLADLRVYSVMEAYIEQTSK